MDTLLNLLPFLMVALLCVGMHLFGHGHHGHRRRPPERDDGAAPHPPELHPRRP